MQNCILLMSFGLILMRLHSIKQLQTIKKENADLEKLVSKLLDNITPLIFLFLAACTTTLAQKSTSFDQGKLYTLGKIEVTGIMSFSPQTVIAYTGLRKGQQIRIPGDDISAVINKLWKLELFSDINIFVTIVNNNNISLELEIVELPTLTNVKINGLKKSKIEVIIKDTDLVEGKKLSESFLTNTKNYIIKQFKFSGVILNSILFRGLKFIIIFEAFKSKGVSLSIAKL